MNDIPRLCAEAARAWNAMLKDDVMDDITRNEAVGLAMKASEACGMPLQAVLDRGNMELRAQMASEG